MYAVSKQLTRKRLFPLFLENVNSYKISQNSYKISQRKLVVKKIGREFFNFFQIQRKKSPFSKISGYVWTGP